MPRPFGRREHQLILNHYAAEVKREKMAVI